MLLLDARHGFKKADIEFLEQLYDPKGPSPLGKRVHAPVGLGANERARLPDALVKEKKRNKAEQ